MWNKINRLKGIASYQTPQVLLHQNMLTRDEQQLVELFAEKFEMSSQGSNYEPRFRQPKKQIESQTVVLDDLETHPINAPFSLLELGEALFLQGCSFTVRINNTVSSIKRLQNGIPRGSVINVTFPLKHQ